ALRTASPLCKPKQTGPQAFCDETSQAASKKFVERFANRTKLEHAWINPRMPLYPVSVGACPSRSAHRGNFQGVPYQDPVMPVPKTVQEFLALVRQSGVVAEPLLERFLKEQGAAVSDAAPPGTLARLLMQAGLLTHFQADQLLQGKWRRFSIGRYKVLEQI